MTRPKLSVALLFCALCGLFCAQEIAAHKIIEEITDVMADVRDFLADVRILNANRKAKENEFCVDIAGEHSVFDSAEGGCRCKRGFMEDDMGICVAGGEAAAAGEVESGEAEPGLGKLKMLLSLVACAAIAIWVWLFAPRRNVQRVGAEGVGAIGEDTCVICFDGTKTHLVCRNQKPDT